MLKLLSKTLALTFYQQHAGLFAIVAYLLFGMMQGFQLLEFHYALANSICSSPVNILLMFGLWVIYALRSIYYVKQKLSLDEYRFTFALLGVERKVQINLWSRVYLLLFFPILAYASLMVTVSLTNGHYWSIISTVIILIGLILGSGFITYRITNQRFITVKRWISIPSPNLKTSFYFWPLMHLFKNQPLMLFLCKLISFLFLKAILAVFYDVGNDLRVYLTAMLSVVLSHAMLLTNLIKFDACYLSFAKSLSIHPLKRLLLWLSIFALLLLPEFIILAWHNNWDLTAFAPAMIFSLSSLIFLQVLFYLVKGNSESYLRLILFFFFVVMIGILAGQYLAICAVMLAVVVLFYLFKYEKLDLKTYG